MTNSAAANPVPLALQIACIQRELTFRRKCYPRWVTQGKLTQEAADQEVERLLAVEGTLRSLQDGVEAAVPDARQIKAEAYAKVLDMCAAHMHSSKVVAIQNKLRAEP